jgi:hypothetical protein
MYQFVDGHWISVNNRTNIENEIPSIREDLTTHEEAINDLTETTTTIDGKITALQNSVTQSRGIEQ